MISPWVISLPAPLTGGCLGGRRFGIGIEMADLDLEFGPKKQEPEPPWVEFGVGGVG